MFDNQGRGRRGEGGDLNYNQAQIKINTTRICDKGWEFQSTTTTSY